MTTTTDNRNIPSNTRYTALISTASAAGLLAGSLFWLAGEPYMWHPDLLRVGGVGAGMFAAWLAMKAAQGGRGLRNPNKSSRAKSMYFSPSQSEASSQAPTTEDAGPSKLVSALERERDRLRSSGYNETEISQILIAREANGPTTRGSLGVGAATGFLNNLDAVVMHARSFMPGFKSDLEHIFDDRVDAATRVSASLAMTVKIAALMVIGYVAYIEAVQLRSQAYKSWAEACIERQKNAINFTPMNKLLSGEAMRELDKECAP